MKELFIPTQFFGWVRRHKSRRKHFAITYLSGSSTPGDAAPEEWPALLLSDDPYASPSTWLAVRTDPSSKMEYPSSILFVPRQNIANDSELGRFCVHTSFPAICFGFLKRLLGYAGCSAMSELV